MWPFKRKRYKFDLDQFVELLHHETNEFIKDRDDALAKGDKDAAQTAQICMNILFGIHNAIVGLKSTRIVFNGARTIQNR